MKINSFTKSFLITCFLFAGFYSFAQNATLHIEIKNAKTDIIYLFDKINISSSEPVLLKLVNNKAIKKVNAVGNAVITISQHWGDDNNPTVLTYDFYLSPGDDIYFTANADKKDFDIKVTGKGAANNHPMRIKELGRTDFENDTLPNNLIAAVKNLDIENKKIFADYIKDYNPSKNFIDYWNIELTYIPVWEYYSFSTGHKFKIGNNPNFQAIYPIWQKSLDSVLATVNLNNEHALHSHSYKALIRWFVVRKKEDLWYQSDIDSVSFLKEWYRTSNVDSAMKTFISDRENNVMEMIINKYFTGQVAEYLYANLFDGMKNDKMDNAIPIYERFIAQYPKSKYISSISPMIHDIKKNLARKWK